MSQSFSLPGYKSSHVPSDHCSASTPSIDISHQEPQSYHNTSKIQDMIYQIGNYLKISQMKIGFNWLKLFKIGLLDQR